MVKNKTKRRWDSQDSVVNIDNLSTAIRRGSKRVHRTNDKDNFCKPTRKVVETPKILLDDVEEGSLMMREDAVYGSCQSESASVTIQHETDYDECPSDTATFEQTDTRSSLVAIDNLSPIRMRSEHSIGKKIRKTFMESEIVQYEDHQTENASAGTFLSSFNFSLLPFYVLR